jgi:hypothetical protein
MSFAGVKSAMLAPWGSVMTANRPTVGTSSTTTTLPPRAFTRATASSTLATSTFVCQWGGAPSRLAASGSTLTPPTGPWPLTHIV